MQRRALGDVTNVYNALASKKRTFAEVVKGSPPAYCAATGFRDGGENAVTGGGDDSKTIAQEVVFAADKPTFEVGSDVQANMPAEISREQSIDNGCLGKVEKVHSDGTISVRWFVDYSVHAVLTTVSVNWILAPNKEEVARRDPQCRAAYLKDMFHSALQEQNDMLVPTSFMDHQTDINKRMRTILLDWLFEVHWKYKLRPETLFLMVSIIDRYLEKKSVVRKKLQLVGLASMMIAAKYEEMYPPELRDYIYICDSAYDREEFLKMEVDILMALHGMISTPTIGHFMQHYMTLNCVDDQHRHLMQYVIEFSLLDASVVGFPPSLMAAAGALLSNKLLKRQPSWPPVMVEHTQLTEADVQDCARQMCCLFEARKNSKDEALRKKFSTLDYGGVGKMSFEDLDS